MEFLWIYKPRHCTCGQWSMCLPLLFDSLRIMYGYDAALPGLAGGKCDMSVAANPAGGSALRSALI